MDLIPNEKLPVTSLGKLPENISHFILNKGHELDTLTIHKIQLQSFQSFQKLNQKTGDIPIEHIREFLIEPTQDISVNTQQLSTLDKETEKETRDIALFKGGKFAEHIIQKQTFLELNNYFDPSKYFGGLDIPDLDEYIPDERLEDMFLEYLSTEMEEKEEVEQKVPVKNKAALQEKIMIKTVKLVDKENCKDALNVIKSPQNQITTEKKGAAPKSKSPANSYAAQLFKKKIIPQESSSLSNMKKSKSKTPNIYGSKRLNGTANSKNSSGILNTEASVGNKSVKSSQELVSFMQSFMSPSSTSRNSKFELAKPKSCNSKMNDKTVEGNSTDIASSPRSCIKLIDKFSPQLKSIDAKSLGRIPSHRTLFIENPMISKIEINTNNSRNIEKQALNSSRTQNSSNDQIVLTKNDVSIPVKLSSHFLTNKSYENEGAGYKSRSANPSFVEDLSLLKRTKVSNKANPVAKGTSINTSRQIFDKPQENDSVACIKQKKAEPKSDNYLKHPKISGFGETSKNSFSLASKINTSVNKVLKYKIV